MLERREPHRKPFRRAEVHGRAGQGPFEGRFRGAGRFAETQAGAAPGRLRAVQAAKAWAGDGLRGERDRRRRTLRQACFRKFQGRSLPKN